MASTATTDGVCDTSGVSALCSNLFGDISSRDWHDPFHWWFLKPLAVVIGPKLVHAGRRVQTFEHDRRNGVYGKKKMAYFVPVEEESLKYNFIPKVQYNVEQLLVEYWDSILAMLVARRNGADVEFDDDVRDAVLGPFADLLKDVDRTRRCGSAAEFAAAVEWLIETKELPCLRVHVCGERENIERGPTHWSREGDVAFQLATALPNAARGWWYSEAALLDEFVRRGAADATADDVAVLFDSTKSAERVARKMRVRPARGLKYLWVPSATKVTPHSIVGQLDGDGVERPPEYSPVESFPRQALQVWGKWKSGGPATPTRLVTELSAPPTAPLPSRTDNAALF
mmetsp:Transcript_31103/g.100224  ORF Transcript_31103/g.100224 Transcript_31103/m.100224 type:complete len:342 (-) Transcript_31103:1414-2439(-)